MEAWSRQPWSERERTRAIRIGDPDPDPFNGRSNTDHPHFQIRATPTTSIDSERMGAVVTAVIAIAAVVLGWITIEMACKPCLETGRRAMDRALDPNYDPDDSPRAPNATTTTTGASANEPLLADLSTASAATPAKAI
ncbi:hypothetical protein PR202_gb12275 [Eleusine coracana subsp. coracana]|uniref:Transmembrane protein n=2 Tax=Eleusine coracana subsp. coracana TaxID=191504 RepID=A0AAV5EPP0_ELECO|nr:hypothetical protein PR202_gb12275 [Eleusine coracana subsp. coracana]